MSEESMVERVARAIYHGKARNKPWEVLPVEFQRQYHKQARAAMREMREPTDAMKVSGGLKAEAIMFEDDKDGTGVIFEDMGHVFSTMIGAALKGSA